MSVAPPPPPLPVKTTAEKEKNIAGIQLPKELSECKWAAGYPELQKGCFLSRVCQYAHPKQCQYYDIPSLLQVGPTCGLTALSMLLNGKPTAAELLADAIVLKYTINGEMFSAQYLCELTQKHFKSIFYKGILNCAYIKEQLTTNGCLLVPYDADGNHAPCQKSGHKAHWALIVGYLIDDQDEFYVLARHGKTRNLAVWTLSSLSQSNANLVEFAQPNGYPDCTFLLPPGGLDGPLGLKERAILIKGLTQAVVKIV
ncbi:UPF0692 protein CG33108 [Drosophila innubila]|uniref:UPF0692 protein CG33108 n=1 Tax=Drosophila innubila TaxID=198719 RepID=UPI00148DE546|nr:UPF0692 protein CG33108 [Drosophila innubila]